jgi:mandelate racemase
VRAVRKRLPDQIELMVDFNQALSFAEALERGRALDSEGIAWIEEPIRHDDFRNCAELASTLATPIQIGENFSLPEQMAEAITAKACDFVMPDLERIGGVTGWLRAASLAAERKLPMSSHLFPETSAHLLAVTPTCHYLEYVDWADAILAEPMKIVDGEAVIPDRPGTGVSWNKKAVKRYEMA